MKIKILWVSECACYSTGFGNTARHILSRIHQDPKFEIRQLALGYNGHPELARQIPFMMYPCNVNGFGEDSFMNIITTYKPNIVVFFGDPWHSKYVFGDTNVAGKMIPFVDPSIRKQMQFVTYYPLDGLKPLDSWIDQMALADYSVFCARFAEKASLDIRNYLRTRYIPHGVDTNIFRPVLEKEKIEYRNQLPLNGDIPYLVGIVGRNQARKGYPVLFQAIKIARESIPDLYLYCHCLRQDQGWDLEDLAKQIGVSDRVIFNQSLSVPNAGVSDETMRLIYGSMDLFALPTRGEGFGLPLLEAMSCGIPCVGTDYAATGELIRESNAGLLVKDDLMVYAGGDNNLCRPETSVTDLAEKIIYAYKNRDEMKRFGENGRKFALTMDWNMVANSFSDFFKDIMVPSENSQIIARDVA